MKIYVSEKDRALFVNSLIGLELDNGSIKGKLTSEGFKALVDLKYNQNIVSVHEIILGIESLEQHDAEMKVKWNNEFLEFIKKNEYCVGDYNIEKHYAIATDILKQKLKEMKGESE